MQEKIIQLEDTVARLKSDFELEIEKHEKLKLNTIKSVTEEYEVKIKEYLEKVRIKILKNIYS